jgi:hypothetical protein
MKILILTADYERFLNWHYMHHPGLHQAPYAEQLQARFATLFGVSDFYSRNFCALGHDATEIYVNNIWLQSAWARENGLSVPMPPSPTATASAASSELIVRLKRQLKPFRRQLEPLARRLGFITAISAIQQTILMAQIESAKPDIILNLVPGIIRSDILRRYKQPGRVIIAQHGNDFPQNFDPSAYSFGIGIVPSIVEGFKARGLPAEYFRLGFDQVVLDRLPPPAPAKDIEVSFIGGLSHNHTKRIELLEAVAREFPIQLYLSNFKGIAGISPLHGRVKGELWGSDMYEGLRRSKITINSHVDAAGGVAANMRLYEATGVGTFLLTDNLRGLTDLFTPGRHIAAYDSAADCVAKIKYYLAHEAEREAVARAGQEHTLRHHTYRQRVEELLGLVEKYRK